MDIQEKPTDIKIRGVKVGNDKYLEVNKHIPRNVFFSIIVGQPGSGKSSLWQNLLSKYYKGIFDKVYLFTGSIHTLPEPLLKKLNPKRVYSKLEADTLKKIVAKTKEEQCKSLLILDDNIADINSNKELKNLIKTIVFNRRHIPMYVMLISQKLREIPLPIRQMADSIYFFNFQNRKEVESLYDDFIQSLEKDEYKDLIGYMLDKNETGHDFLYINRHKKDKYYRNFNELEFIKE